MDRSANVAAPPRWPSCRRWMGQSAAGLGLAKPGQTGIWLGCAALDARAGSIAGVLRMEQGVVVSAVELEVAEFGRAAVRPVPYVVRFAALWRHRAAWRLAVAVAQLQGLVHARGQRP